MTGTCKPPKRYVVRRRKDEGFMRVVDTHTGLVIEKYCFRSKAGRRAANEHAKLLNAAFSDDAGPREK
jgi:hypothetical protein